MKKTLRYLGKLAVSCLAVGGIIVLGVSGILNMFDLAFEFKYVSGFASALLLTMLSTTAVSSCVK